MKARFRKPNNKKINKEDRISRLPDEILHEILSHISMDEAVVTSKLSRRWNEVWTTLPYLNIHLSLNSKTEFIWFIKKILVNYCERTSNICIPKFCLTLESWDFGLSGYVDTLAQCLTHCDIKELVFYLPSSIYDYLPPDIFRVNSITVLRLSGGSSALVSRMASNIELIHLKILSLREVVVSKLLIQRIIATSLNLEELSIECCDCVTSIMVKNLVRLKLLRLKTNRDLRMIDVDAPSLERFFHFEGHRNLCKIKFTNCSNVREMMVSPTNETGKDLSERLSTLEHLECLNIWYCERLQFPIISSNSLTSLEIHSCDRLYKADIDTPNLKTLKLYGGKIFSISLNAPPELKAELCFSCLAEIGPNEFIDLVKLLGELNDSKSVSLVINVQNEIIPKEWKIHFARIEYLTLYFWLGTNIGILDVIQMIFPNLNIYIHEGFSTARILLSSDDAMGKKEKNEEIERLVDYIVFKTGNNVPTKPNKQNVIRFTSMIYSEEDGSANALTSCSSNDVKHNKEEDSKFKCSSVWIEPRKKKSGSNKPKQERSNTFSNGLKETRPTGDVTLNNMFQCLDIDE